MTKKYYVIVFLMISTMFGCHCHKDVKDNEHNHDENHSRNTVNHSHSFKGYFGAYTVEDTNFGTKTNVTLTSDKRLMVTNSLPNHKTGEFPRKGNPNTISAQKKTYSFPLNPKYTGRSQWVREPGVALNGIKFEPGTAEVVVCNTGENYRVEAFQEIINLGLDFNNAHVQPTGEYHYHGIPISFIKNNETSTDLVHVGFAHDGFPIYYSQSNAYKPSYRLISSNRKGEDCTYTNPKKTIDIELEGHHDGTFTSDFEFVEGLGDLDECNGVSINGVYKYFITDMFPYISRCLKGEFISNERRRPSRRERPNLSQIFKQMDSDNDGKLSKNEVKGPLYDEFTQIDSNKDGFISKDEIERIHKNN